jgi:two-component system, cell cycle sensor histidine kinase and response regulator CckA
MSRWLRFRTSAPRARRLALSHFPAAAASLQNAPEERKTERARREDEGRTRAIFEAALDCIVTMDHAGLITGFNPAAEHTFGYSHADVIGKPLADLLVPPSLRARHIEGLRHYLATGEGPVLGKRIEIQAMRADRAEFPVELAIVPIRSEGAPPSFTAYIRDITERRRAVEALGASEARFKHLAESGIIGIIITDASGQIDEANDEFLRIVGFSRQDLLSGKLRWNEITPPEWRAGDEAAIEQLARTGVATPWEKEYLRKDGTRAKVLVGVVVHDAPRAIAFVSDLTALKRAEEAGAAHAEKALRETAARQRTEEMLRHAEEQLRQAQKMEAVGRLAGGVAHDFNNMLSVIIGFSDMLLSGLSAVDPMRGDVAEIRTAAGRASDLTRQLLAFSRQQVLEPRVLDLNEILGRIENMLRRLIGEDIELYAVKGEGLGKVLVDPGQVEQVIVNLVVNARDAMPQGGRITLETAMVVFDESYMNEHLGAASGEHVMLAVTDTGTGMDQATKDRIFEPFFTTKSKDKGTGLGLSMVFGTVAQSGGHIWVYSEPGKGTTFKLYFPTTAAKDAKAAMKPNPSAAELRGSETILLAEDEEQVRRVSSRILRRYGYQVIEAQNANEALALARSHVGPIHLLVTDVVMPNMSGPELARLAAIVRPGIKVLCMSGYTDDSVFRHGLLEPGVAFLQKPATPVVLATKVRQLLDEQASDE